MKRLLPAFILILFCAPLYAQQKLIAKLQQQLKEHPQPDTFRVNRLNDLSQMPDLSFGRRDTLSYEAYQLAKKLNYTQGIEYAIYAQAYNKRSSGNATALDSLMKILQGYIATTSDDRLKIKYLILKSRIVAGTANSKKQIIYLMEAEKIALNHPDKVLIVDVWRYISDYYTLFATDFVKGLEWALKAEKASENYKHSIPALSLYSTIANVYFNIGETDKARLYFKKGLKLNEEIQLNQLQSILLNNLAEIDRLGGNYKEALQLYIESLKYSIGLDVLCIAYGNIGDTYYRMGNYPEALKWSFQGLRMSRVANDISMSSSINATLAKVYLKKNMTDSALFYARKGLAEGEVVSSLEYSRDNAEALAQTYAKIKNFEKAYQYNRLYYRYRDSMINSQVTNKTSLLAYNYDMAKKEAEITKLNEEKKLQRYLLITAACVLCVIVIAVLLLVRANRQRQKAFDLLNKQKQVIQEQRDETNQALSDLKLAQSQLVQAEKMASLGELTAGIAHEIQNPLNFVNNFSEVSAELVDEMEAEIAAGNMKEIGELTNDLKQNLQMINHHGKRADNIVKGMLQHSRTGSGKKENTDLNRLANEYLNLAYHGYKAKSKDFNTQLNTSLADGLPAIQTVSQDVGRVLLNLFNNAFYAVQQKAKNGIAGYKPEVSLTTNVTSHNVSVVIKDNGIGIPHHIQDKIMQPFFTTKPTGEGTGLGLSLSYDIIVKGHSGTMNVESEPGEFTEFTITLPL